MTGLQEPTGSFAAPRSVDVARLVGVSRKTVSRALNDEPYVSPEVRRRVLDAAEALGYRMNNAAPALASGRARAIGVVTLGTAGYGVASLLVAIERAVQDAGYAEHLLDHGHVTVHRLTGPQRWNAARDRLEGWRAVLEARRRGEHGGHVAVAVQAAAGPTCRSATRARA